MNSGNLKVKHVITSCGCDCLIPFTMVLLFDIILHGHLSPGGGFQGGVLMVAVFTLIYLGYGYDSIRMINGSRLHKSEGLASIVYVIFAMCGVAYGGYFCENILFQSGKIGDLWSSGTIFLMNAAVGAKVLTGVGMLALYMLAVISQMEQDS